VAIRARLKCPSCDMRSDWDIKLGKNWYIRCYKCGVEYDLERAKRQKTTKPIKSKRRRKYVGWFR